MPLASLFFLLGTVLVQQLARLPDPSILIALSFSTLILVWRQDWPLVFLLSGLIWTSLFANWQLEKQLPSSAVNQELIIEGYISSLPQKQGQRYSFDFVLTHPNQQFPDKIRLNWYQAELDLAAGQNWRLPVKLKPPHSRLNPGGFDYEAWLFANRIGANGYVRTKPAPQVLPDSFSLGRFFARFRQTIANRIDQALPDGQQIGLLKALSIGSQNSISQSQWQVFRITGVIHLIVISGSHISLIAGLVFLWVRRFWARTGILSLAPQSIAASASWLSAMVYAGLAGFNIPCLRAVLMLSITLAALVWQRHSSPFHILALALLSILIVDPLAVLTVGFWLSFAAIGLLIYLASGRLKLNHTWKSAARSQLLITLGLAPLLVMFFQQFSLIAPIANWIAVPIVGIIVVPLLLIAVSLLFCLPALGELLLKLCDQLLQALYWLLSQLAELPLANLNTLDPPWYVTMLALAGVLLILSPKGFPCRYLSPLFFLPIFLLETPRPEPGEVWLSLLDVGQGLATVVQTSQHTLVFDTGAKYADNSDMGDSVLLPFLHHQGLSSLDQLIISHADNDHSGGANAILTTLPVKQISSSASAWAELPNGHYCEADQSWTWDQVEFQILSPPNSHFSSENDNSCVLKISHKQQQFLLTGDIEISAEDWLVKQYGPELKSSVLIAPHHGSKTSSSLEFLQQVEPELILIPAGYLNRFKFPHPQVLKRYQQIGSNWLSTANEGAIQLKTKGSHLEIIRQRKQQQRYWMTNPADAFDP